MIVIIMFVACGCKGSSRSTERVCNALLLSQFVTKHCSGEMLELLGRSIIPGRKQGDFALGSSFRSPNLGL